MRREPGGRQHTTTCWPVLPARDLRNFASTTWPGTTATPCLTDARPAHASKGNDDACSTWSQGTSTPLSCLSWTTPSLPNSIGTTSPWAACMIEESRSTMRTGWIRWGGLEIRPTPGAAARHHPTASAYSPLLMGAQRSPRMHPPLGGTGRTQSDRLCDFQTT